MTPTYGVRELKSVSNVFDVKTSCIKEIALNKLMKNASILGML